MPEIEDVTEKIQWTAELLAQKLNTTIEEVAAAKTLDWGWKELVEEHAEALGDLLSKAVNCVNLNMFVNELGPPGGKALGRALPYMVKLVQADLQQWQVTPEGAKYIADAVATHPRIKSLKMHYCKLGWEGTEYIAKAVANHKTLTNLDLGDNGMDEAGARHIAAMLTSNTSLTRLECVSPPPPSPLALGAQLARTPRMTAAHERLLLRCDAQPLEERGPGRQSRGEGVVPRPAVHHLQGPPHPPQSHHRELSRAEVAPERPPTAGSP